MATDTATFSGGQYRAELDVTVSGSTVTAKLRVEKLSGAGYWTAGSEPWRINIDGTVYDGTWTYDFRSATWETVATKSRNVGYQGTTNVSAWVEMQSPMGRSATMSVNVTVAKEPGAPGAPSLTFVAPDEVDVAWSAAASNGSSIDEYQVQRSGSSDMSSPFYTNTGTSRSTTISGFAAGVTRYFRVRAHNGEGWGDWSPIRSIQIPGPPSRPAAPSLSLILPDQIVAEWTAPSSGQPITGYDYQIATNSGMTGATEVSQTGTSRTVTRSIGTTYYIRVRAKSSQGESEWSPVASITIPDHPATPGTPTISNIGPTGFTASWTAPANGGAAITGYDVELEGVGVYDQTALSRVFGSLAPGADYRVRVRAKNSQGASDYSAWANVRTLSGAYLSIDGDAYEAVEVYASVNGGPYLPATVYFSEDGAAYETVS